MNAFASEPAALDCDIPVLDSEKPSGDFADAEGLLVRYLPPLTYLNRGITLVGSEGRVRACEFACGNRYP